MRVRVRPLEDAVARSRSLGRRAKQNYLAAVRSFVAHAGGDWSIDAVERWRDHLSGAMRPATVNLCLSGLRYASRRAARAGACDDFAADVVPLPLRGAGARPAGDGEVERMLASCAGGAPIDLRDRAILLLLRAGLRRSRIAAVRAGDLDQAGGRPRLGGVELDAECASAAADWILALCGEVPVCEGPMFRSIGRRRVDGTWPVGGTLGPGGIYEVVIRRSRAARLRRRITPDMMRRRNT